MPKQEHRQSTAEPDKMRQSISSQSSVNRHTITLSNPDDVVDSQDQKSKKSKSIKVKKTKPKYVFDKSFSSFGHSTGSGMIDFKRQANRSQNLFEGEKHPASMLLSGDYETQLSHRKFTKSTGRSCLDLGKIRGRKILPD